MKTVGLLSLVLFLVVASETIEGSGESVEMDPDLEIVTKVPTDPYVETYKLLKNRLSEPIIPTHLNSTVQLELVRADSELYRGRIGLTLWIHESWLDSTLSVDQSDGLKRLVLPIESILPHIQTPATLVKNALYFKEHATPYIHGFVTVFPNGTVVSHRKITVDLPCDKQFLASEKGQIDYGYGIRGIWQNSCVLKYGSYSRPKDLLNLSWHPIAIVEQKIPCGSTASKTSGACDVVTTTTSKHIEEFADEIYDEVVAEFQIELVERN